MYWPGFTVYMTYSNISLSSMYINHCEMSVELPYLRYIVVLLPQKRFLNYFEGSWVRRLLLLLIEGQGLNSCFEGLQRWSDFSPENRTVSPSNLRSKSVEKFTYLAIENPSKRPAGFWFYEWTLGWLFLACIVSVSSLVIADYWKLEQEEKKWKWEWDGVKTRF